MSTVEQFIWVNLYSLDLTKNKTAMQCQATTGTKNVTMISHHIFND